MTDLVVLGACYEANQSLCAGARAAGLSSVIPVGVDSGVTDLHVRASAHGLTMGEEDQEPVTQTTPASRRSKVLTAVVTIVLALVVGSLIFRWWWRSDVRDATQALELHIQTLEFLIDVIYRSFRCSFVPINVSLLTFVIFSAVNDYHYKDRIEILFINSCSKALYFFSQPDFSRQFWNYRTLTRMSTVRARATKYECECECNS